MEFRLYTNNFPAVTSKAVATKIMGDSKLKVGAITSWDGCSNKWQMSGKTRRKLSEKSKHVA